MTDCTNFVIELRCHNIWRCEATATRT